jgi:hypothetical protein
MKFFFADYQLIKKNNHELDRKITIDKIIIVSLQFEK